MCFIHDYDWTARVCEETAYPAQKPTECDECGAVIPIGGGVYHVHMEEYDGCRQCYLGECECGEEGCCRCPEPDPGETFDYDRCESCEKFLYAVQEAEEEAGCEGSEARPALGTMLEDIQNGGRHDAKRYWKLARQHYPELVTSGYLGRLWKRIFA